MTSTWNDSLCLGLVQTLTSALQKPLFLRNDTRMRSSSVTTRLAAQRIIQQRGEHGTEHGSDPVYIVQAPLRMAQRQGEGHCGVHACARPGRGEFQNGN